MSEYNPVKTDSDIEIEPLYKPDENFNYSVKLGDPGKYPYTRGIYPQMYGKKIWTMRQYAGFGSAIETNRRFSFLLKQGQTGLSLAFDLPTQLGFDPDHPLSDGEVGRTGVSVTTLQDTREIFSDIPLEKISLSMTINATAPELLSLYIITAEERGILRQKLRGTVQNDILKEFVARGNYIYPVEPSIRLTADLIEFCTREMPLWNPISISGYHYREAGATAIQEVAFTISDGIEYINRVLERGLEIDDIAPRLSFFFSAHSNFFEEIAKFRAARRVWAKLIYEKFKAKNPKSHRLRFHTQTGGVTLTRQEPLNNIVRVSLQALSAVLGGTQSLHTNAYDEALGLPTEESVLIALRTQQILAYETGVTHTADPIGGSYFTEKLTDKIEEKVFDLLDEIDKLGGAAKAVEEGFFRHLIEKSAYELEKKVEAGEKKVIGVNLFKQEKESNYRGLGHRQEIEDMQKRKLQHFKKKRDNKEVEEKLLKLQEEAQSDKNLIYPIMEALKSGATIGETSGILRKIFGEYNGK